MKKDFRHTSGALEDRFFYGREDEIENIHTNIDIRQHTALIGQRQFGKTSLILKAIEKDQHKPLLAHIDLTRKGTLAEASKVLIDSFMSDNFGLKRFLIMATTNPTELFKKFVASINKFNPINKIKIDSFELEIKELSLLATMEDAQKSIDLFVNTIELIDEIATQTQKQVVIFIDEFQRIVEFPEVRNSDFMWSFRSAIQDSKNITLIVAGSKPSVVKSIISNPDGAFLHSFLTENIYGIKEADFVSHFNSVCSTYSVIGDTEVTKFVHSICSGIPSYLSLFGRRLFNNVKKTKVLTREMYFIAIEEMFLEINSTLRLQEEKLNEIQYAILVYSNIFLGENPKKSAAQLSDTSEQNIQNNTLKKMEELGYINKIARGEYKVIDNIMGYYIAEITTREQFENLFKDKVLQSYIGA